MIYEFVLDTESLQNKKMTFDEIIMIHHLMELLEANRKFVLSRFKKYTKEEYMEELRQKEERSKRMLESLQQIIIEKFSS